MKTSYLFQLVDRLGYDPETLAAVTVTPDEIELTAVGGGKFKGHGFISPQDVFNDLDEMLREDAPTEIFEEFESIRMDVRGVSAPVPSGMTWHWPWAIKEVVQDDH